MQKAQPGAAASTEVSAKAKGHACKNAIENIASQVLPAQAHNLCAGSGYAVLNDLNGGYVSDHYGVYANIRL